MPNTIRNWIDDIPQQFLEKKNIEVLISAFVKQIDELYKVFDDLKIKTTLDHATGKNLWYVGDILSLSMKEAQEILKSAVSDDITDETYRKVLQYKSLKNNCECTYDDIMHSIKMLWNTSDIKYVEDPKHPATIYITLPSADLDGIDPTIGLVLAIKPSGVGMVYSVSYLAKVDFSSCEKVTVPKITIATPTEVKEKMTPAVRLACSYANIKEAVTATMISLKDFWALDGTCLLDGTKLLDANRKEEVL